MSTPEVAAASLPSQTYGRSRNPAGDMETLAFAGVSARIIVQQGASGTEVLLTTRVVRRPLLADGAAAPTMDDDAAFAQQLQLEEEERDAAERAQTEGDAEMARELAGLHLPKAAAPPPPPPPQQPPKQPQQPLPSHAAFGVVVLEGLLEKKPVRGLGMMERGLFPNGGWRARRVVLRERVPPAPVMVADAASSWRVAGACCQLEWHHTDEDEVGVQCLRLELASARVRRGGDVGDDDAERLLTVEAQGQGYGQGQG